MNINIKSTGFELTDAISDHVHQELATVGRLLQERGDRSALVQVEVGKTTNHHKNGDVYRAEINLFISGESFRAEAETGDLYASVNEARDLMTNQLAHTRDKKTGLVRRGARAIKAMLKGIPGFRDKR
jgi:ribosomal subunit interface protein